MNLKSFKDHFNEACWDGYKQVGMKKKGKRMVPNCVPESSKTNERKLTKVELKDREKYVKKLKPKLKDFKKRYGDEEGKGMMYAVATNMAKKKSKKD